MISISFFYCKIFVAESSNNITEKSEEICYELSRKWCNILAVVMVGLEVVVVVVGLLVVVLVVVVGNLVVVVTGLTVVVDAVDVEFR